MASPEASSRLAVNIRSDRSRPGFATPYAHPGNLLVMGPANYRFGDFVRMGLPLGLLTLAGSFILLSLIFRG